MGRQAGLCPAVRGRYRPSRPGSSRTKSGAGIRALGYLSRQQYATLRQRVTAGDHYQECPTLARPIDEAPPA
jgi:hypothetical protein